MFELVIHDGQRTGLVQLRPEDEVSVGAAPNSVIRLFDPRVAACHARIVATTRDLLFEVVRGADPVRVNGKRVPRRCRLCPGDWIAIGHSCVEVRLSGGDEMPRNERQADARSQSAVLLPVVDEPVNGPQLVRLGGAHAGRACPILDDEPVSLGRASDADVSIDSALAAPYHVEIMRDQGQIYARVLGNASAMTVSGRTRRQAKLHAGDTLGVGDARFAIVDVEASARSRRNRLRRAWQTAAAALAVLGIAGGLWATGGLWVRGKQPDVEGDGRNVALDTTGGTEAYVTAMAACHRALARGASDQAIAQADRALSARPADPQATACHTQALALEKDRDVFERGTELLRDGAPGEAYRLFASLSPNSPLRERNEVRQAANGLAVEHLMEAGALLGSDPGAALRAAGSVIELQGVDETHRLAAHTLVEMVRAVAEAEDLDVPRVATHDGEATVDVAVAQLSSAIADSAGRPSPVPPKALDPAHAATPDALRGEATGSAPAAPDPQADFEAIEAATACIARSDAACVAAALRGHTPNEPSLVLLIDAYLDMGDRKSAHEAIRQYVARYPDRPRAKRYRKLIDQ